MGNIERKIIEILKSKSITESPSNDITPQVQLFLDECDRMIAILKDDDLFKQEQSKHNLNEGLSPEVSNKAKIIFKSMINDRRDQLFKRYGAEAEKVAYGKAIAQAKRGLESPLEEINSDSYIQTRNQNPLIRDIANRIMERLKYSTK
jgi:hypothetical protein